MVEPVILARAAEARLRADMRDTIAPGIATVMNSMDIGPDRIQSFQSMRIFGIDDSGIR